MEERIEVMGRQGKRCKQLLDDVKERRGVLDSSVCVENLQGRGCGQDTELVKV